MSYNPLLKLWYKIFDKIKYQDIKNKRRLEEKIKFYNSHIYDKIVEIQKKIENNKNLSFLHSGHLGDIMYSLPVIKELSKSHTCNLYIQINKPVTTQYISHPYGNVLLNEKVVNLLLPLLRKQTFLKSVNIYKNGTYDLVTNTFPRSYPVGQSVEVIRTSTFKKAYRKMLTPDHFEHVTKYYYEHADKFRIKNFSNDRDLSRYRLVVDTPEDLERMQKIIGSMTRSHTEYGLDDLIELYPLVPEKKPC